jgi:hypothetical protein
MQLESAKFTFVSSNDSAAVDFEGDTVTVIIAAGHFRFDNKPAKWGGRTYKPCETHARDLLRRALKPHAKARPQEEQRKKKVPHKLRLLK